MKIVIRKRFNGKYFTNDPETSWSRLFERAFDFQTTGDAERALKAQKLAKVEVLIMSSHGSLKAVALTA